MALSRSVTYSLAAVFAAVAWLVARSYGFGICASVALTLVAAYLPSYFDGTEFTAEGRPWPAFADLKIFKDSFSYFPASLHFEQKLDPGKQYIFASAPHGVYSLHHGMLLTNGVGFHEHSPIERRRDIGASVIFKIPLYREFILWTGVVDAGAPTCKKVLAKGLSMGVLVGGVNEQVTVQRGVQAIAIKNKTGFCKLALQYGVPIVPSYAFGETELYTTTKILYGLRYFLMKKFRIGLPVGWGPNLLVPWWPHRVPLVLCFGTPIPVTKIENPTPEQVNELHNKYIAKMTRIFDTNKTRLGYGDKTLVIQ